MTKVLVAAALIGVAGLAGCSSPLGSASIAIGSAVAPAAEAALCKDIAKDKILGVKACKTLAGVVVSTATAAAQAEMQPSSGS